MAGREEDAGGGGGGEFEDFSFKFEVMRTGNWQLGTWDSYHSLLTSSATPLQRSRRRQEAMDEVPSSQTPVASSLNPEKAVETTD